MIYVDTSALVALLVIEPHTPAVALWYARTRSELVSAVWCVTEFASALGLKQRTRQIGPAEADIAWDRFGRLVAGDLRLLPVQTIHFERAAALTLDPSSGLRSGDALHLACAEQAGARSIATLDTTLARQAQTLKIKPVPLR